MQNKRKKGSRLETQAFQYCRVISSFAECAVTCHVQFRATYLARLHDTRNNFEPAKAS